MKFLHYASETPMQIRFSSLGMLALLSNGVYMWTRCMSARANVEPAMFVVQLPALGDYESKDIPITARQIMGLK